MDIDENLDNLIINLCTDITGLEEIYNLMKKDVFAYAYSILRDSSLSEDAVSETFIRLYRLSSRYKPKKQGRSFVLKLCKNVSMELYRQSNRQIYTDNLPEIAAEESKDDKIFIDQILSRLNIKERQVVILKHFCDMTFKQIAQSLSIPEGTAKWRYSSGIKKLQGFVLSAE